MLAHGRGKVKRYNFQSVTMKLKPIHIPAVLIKIKLKALAPDPSKVIGWGGPTKRDTEEFNLGNYLPLEKPLKNTSYGTNMGKTILSKIPFSLWGVLPIAPKKRAGTLL